MSKLGVIVLGLVLGCAPNVGVESPVACASGVNASDGVQPTKSARHEGEDEAASAASAAPVAASSVATAPASASAAPKPFAPTPEGLVHRALPQQQLGFYGVLLPPGYDAPENRARRYPIVVILHGSGSSEVKHGVLADSTGREGVIYVLPRAPYASSEQIKAGEEGWTAWPQYPTEWGEYGSAGFPQAQIDKFELADYYTRWIADCVRDARKTYRANGERVVVVGHSQGAGFAHLFAAEYPNLVKAYVAYAGPFKMALESPKVEILLTALKQRHVTALLLHSDNDSVVSSDGTKELDALMTKRGVQHTTHILSGDTHATTAQVRTLIRAFVQEQCCGEKRTGAEVPTSTAEQPLLRAPPVVVGYGLAENCDAEVHTGVACSGAEVGTAPCNLYELEPCGQHSSGYRSTTYQCVSDHWTAVGRHKAECGVQGRDPEVAGCTLQTFRTKPTTLSPVDGCDLVLRCGKSDVVVGCDGENDGTSTSLCDCSRDGVSVRLPQSLYAGEAPASCVAAAQHCAAAK